MRALWLGLAVLGGIGVIAACTDTELGLGGKAGAGGERPASSGGQPASGAQGGVSPRGGRGGSPDAGGPGRGDADSDSGGADSDSGSAGDDNGGSAAGEHTGGAGERGDGGAGGEAPAPTPRLACPPIDEPVVIHKPAAHTDEEGAAALAIGCDFTDNRHLEVRRFQVTERSAVVMYSRYQPLGVWDVFRLDPDCGSTGVLTEQESPFVRYPGVVAQIVEPGTYTAVSCGEFSKLVVEPEPPPPSNVDCEHARPLTSFPYAETRVFEPSRFYSVTFEDLQGPTSEISVILETSQNAGRGFLTLHYGPYTPAYKELDYLNFVDVSFGQQPPGDYCIEISVPKGTQYSVSARVEAQ